MQFGNYTINYGILGPYLGDFLHGIGVTVWLSFLCLVISMPLGLVGALLRENRFWIIRFVVGLYVEVFRNVPLLVQVYVVFYGLPPYGIQASAFVSGMVALSMNNLAYVIEIFRGGLKGVPAGQYEAARSLGLHRGQVFFFVIFRQLMIVTFPSLGNQIVGVVLGSSLVSVVGVLDLTQVSYSVGSLTFRFFETLSFAAVIYLILSQLANLVWTQIGRRLVMVRMK